MKYLFSLLAIMASAHVSSQVSESPCKIMLQNGLYKTFNITRKGSFDQDLKTYFSSNEFKNDFKTNKWSFGIDVVIDSVPIGLSAGSSDTEISKFQKQVSESKPLTVNQKFYDYSLTSIPDVELAREYTNCLVLTRPYGFKLFPDIMETKAIFLVNFSQQYSTNPLPTVTNFILEGGTNILGAYKKGETVVDNRTIYCERNPNVELVFIPETTQGAVTYRVPAESAGFNNDFPVGTILTSYLNWDEFQAVTQNNFSNPAGNFWAKFSKWAPADGRAIPNSVFTKITSQPTLPDFRGVFLRGLNQFDYSQPASQRDPETRARGNYQADTFSNHKHGGGVHTHTTGIWNGAATNFGGPVFRKIGGDNNQMPEAQIDKSGEIIAAEGGAETRQKNITIYYYIRIN